MVLPEAAVLGLSCFRHLKYQKKKKKPFYHHHKFGDL